MRKILLVVVVVLLGAVLSACSDWRDAQTVKVGDGYKIELKTTPAPPLVGDSAAVAVRINDDHDRTVRACHVSFRQYMPEHEMGTDDIIVQMEEHRSGVYSGMSPEYSMGGAWRVEVTFDCGTGILQANFDFTLAWPE